MSIAFVDAWYVSGDSSGLLFETKTAAEMWARKLYPDENPYYRYARIYFKQRQQTLITEKQVKEMTP
jgi:hypothetical protein